MRILAFGDSFVTGAGDPDHLRWVGRALPGRRDVTLYNLASAGRPAPTSPDGRREGPT